MLEKAPTQETFRSAAMQNFEHSFLTLIRRSTAVAACFALGSCGSGDGFQAPGAGGPLQATFGSIQANIFTPSCEPCHSGAGAPFGLRLDPANSYALLVGIASAQDGGVLRVKPGDPDNSYLIQKIAGTAGTGERMPAGLPPLSQAEVAAIRQWITDGAQPDQPNGPLGPIRVTALSPAPNSTESSLPATVIAVFDREVDASTVNATTFLLERSGGDGTFGDGNEVDIVPAAVTVPLANPLSAQLDLSGVSSVEDSYRVTLVGTGAAVVADLDANALDGEFTGTLPSGDGAAGGNFIAEFAVVGAIPTLDSIQDSVFTPICAGCHSGNGAALPGVLDLSDADATYASLVGVASLEVASIERVAAGDADNSYLIQKLEGTASVGVQMPAGGPALSQVVIDVVRQWINDGALR